MEETVFTSQKKKNTISSRQKRILKLLFVLVETIIEIRNNQIFKNWPSLWKMEIRGNAFL